jgi:hypothetical protein
MARSENSAGTIVEQHRRVAVPRSRRSAAVNQREGGFFSPSRGGEADIDQYAIITGSVENDPQRPFATANCRIAKEIYSIVSSARASNTGD